MKKTGSGAVDTAPRKREGENSVKDGNSLAEQTLERAAVCRRPRWAMPSGAILLSFFLVEVFAFLFLMTVGAESAWKFFRGAGYAAQDLGSIDYWPLAFGALWAVLLWGLLRCLPRKAARVLYGIFYFLAVIYAGVQTGYFCLFREMMWLSDFRYASEGSDYFSVLLKYPPLWWVGIVVLLALGILILCRFPRQRAGWKPRVSAGILSALAVLGMCLLPEAVFMHDREVKYAGSDYGRAQSAEAAYTTMFNTHRVYQVCGLYQTAVRDLWHNILYPLTPGYASAQREARAEIDAYFADRETGGANEMTGIFEGKNVILVLMESMDDWALGEHTPTINRMMAEGINFTNFYTPAYGSVRTFNSEFCANTGSFLSSRGGYAFDYVTNDYRQSLASVLTERGYSALTYHYNDPSFYSRGVFEPAMGYEAYLSYADYIEKGQEDLLFDDQLLFDNEALSESFFRQGPKLNFIITRSAHLSYVYNEVLSDWGLEKYPEYQGMTGDEEEDCMYLKARLVDDMFARLLKELEEKGELENTVIVAFTDHYTYGIDDQNLVWERSGVDDALLVEKTPCFIWSAEGPAVEVDKTLNTSDLLPTVLNLLGTETSFDYLGRDAFDESYEGCALFPDGSWVSGGVAYSAASGKFLELEPGASVSREFKEEMSERVLEFVRINNLILETDYYAEDP